MCQERYVKNKEIDKMSFLENLKKKDNNTSNSNADKGIEMTDTNFLYKKENEIRHFEDDLFTKKQKRAFTLGAIDGIGDISLLKAPLINPRNPQIEPPILQLPSKTNLIRNVHIKEEKETNIDKSYKYRTQNSNRDVLNNMKPLYSLPEKVINYYTNPENDKIRKEKNEKKKSEEDLIEESEQAAEEVKERKLKYITTKEAFHTLVCKDNDTIFVEKQENIDDLKEEKKDNMENATKTSSEQTQCTTTKLRSHIDYDTKKETLKQNPNLFEANNPREKKKLIKGSILVKRDDKNDEFSNFALNQIMSSTLTNALKFLGGDIC